MKNYAEFLETIEGDTDLADALYSEANLLEEKAVHEKSKLKTKTLTLNSLNGKMTNIEQKRPNAENKSEYNDMAPVGPEKETKNSFAVAGQKNGDGNDTDSDYQSQSAISKSFAKSQMIGSCAEDKQKNQPKKEFMKRLNVKEDYSGFRLSFFIYPIALILMCLGILWLSITIFNLQNIESLFLKTKLTGIPYLIIR